MPDTEAEAIAQTVTALHQQHLATGLVQLEGIGHMHTATLVESTREMVAYII